jgi:hypothetical protein
MGDHSPIGGAAREPARELEQAYDGATDAEGLTFLFSPECTFGEDVMGTALDIKPDDRVRLQRDLAERLMKHCACKRYKSKRKIDWLHRHGTVLSVSPVTDSVYIRWDGRVSPDVWPFRAVEKVE